MQRKLLLLPALLLVLLTAAATAGAAAPTYKGSSSDGEYLYFEADEQLVPGDTDSKRDLYLRSFDETVGEEGVYVTRQVSVGPTGGNDSHDASFAQVSEDGQLAFFTTAEALVAADKDRQVDVYVREQGGSTKLVSAGATACLPGCGNGNVDAGFVRASQTGDKVMFLSTERLDPAADTDSALDFYLRDLTGSETRLVSAGEPACLPACGNGEVGASFAGLAADGGTAFFSTTESLSAADTDAALDVYVRPLPDGPTALVSLGDPSCVPCGNGTPASIFVSGSADGSRVTFVTTEGLVPGDKDGANDVYQRQGGATTLVSAGAEGKPASFAAASADGTRVFYTTAEPVLGADANGATDIYMWEGGAPQLISSGTCCASSFEAVTPEGTEVFFTTAEKLAVADTDASADVYAQAVTGGPPVLVSAGAPSCSPCGNGELPARFNHVTPDGDRAFFTTKEALSPQDFDDDDDIYARDLTAGTTTLWTPPPGLCPAADCHAIFLDASEDGEHMVFQTEERLDADDVDSEADIYERAFDPAVGSEVTRLVSTGNSSDLDLGPEPPLLQGTSPSGSGTTTEPKVLGQAEPGSLIKIYPNSGCFGEPVATGTAEELAVPGIGVTVAKAATGTFWATAEADGFTSLCSNPVTYTQQDPGTPPTGGEGPPAGGSGPGSEGGAGAGDKDPVKTHDGVPYVKPVTRITFGPAAKTRSRRPVFRFTDATGQPGTRFRCRVDRGRWAKCGSPFRLKRLSPGRHVFRVKGVNAAGTWEERPASRSFKVVKR